MGARAFSSMFVAGAGVGDARPSEDESRLDDVVLAGLAIRESTFDGRTVLEAQGIGPDGASVALSPRRLARGAPADRVALFASLLARGLRAHGPVLVETAGCLVLRRRIHAAWGARAIFVG